MRNKPAILLSLLACSTLALSGCCPCAQSVRTLGSRTLVSVTYDLNGFDKLEIGYGFRVAITQSDRFSVETRADESLSDYVQVIKRGNMLSIGLQPGRPYVQAGRTLEATVTMPELIGCDVSGGSRAEITGFRSERDFEADVSGGARLEGDVQCGDVRIIASGGATVILSGSGEDLVGEASGGATADLDNFQVNNARVEASGGGTLTVNATGRLDAQATGGGRVTYSDSPALGTIESSGGGTIKKR